MSLDDGDHWQSLQLNLPVTGVRDLTIHGDDLVVATFGRSFWILDNITPLRQALDAREERVARGFTVQPQRFAWITTPLQARRFRPRNPRLRILPMAR